MSKIGISVGLLGAVVNLAGLFGGYTAMILLVGYILLFEENDWLKKAAVKAMLIMVSFAFLITLIGLIPDVFSWISSVISVFGGSFNYSFVSSLVSVFTKALDIIRTCLFLALGLKALNQGTISVPFVDKLVEKNF